MTDHAQLSRDLALALGYYPESVRIAPSTYCAVYRNCYGQERWEELDYRDPTVCLPLIERLMREHGALPIHASSTGRFGFACRQIAVPVWAGTLAEAVAKAVIAVKGDE